MSLKVRWYNDHGLSIFCGWENKWICHPYITLYFLMQVQSQCKAWLYKLLGDMFQGPKCDILFEVKPLFGLLPLCNFMEIDTYDLLYKHQWGHLLAFHGVTILLWAECGLLYIHFNKNQNRMVWPDNFLNNRVNIGKRINSGWKMSMTHCVWGQSNPSDFGH